MFSISIEYRMSQPGVGAWQYVSLFFFFFYFLSYFILIVDNTKEEDSSRI